MNDEILTTALGEALRHLLNVLRWDEQQQCYRTPYWFHRGDIEDAKRALAQWRRPNENVYHVPR